MKRLAKFGLVDIAIRKEKALLILICKTPEQAELLFKVLRFSSYRFIYSKDEQTLLKFAFPRYGVHSFSISPENPRFPFRNHFKNKILKFTTGVFLHNRDLGYLKETMPIDPVPLLYPPSTFTSSRSDPSKTFIKMRNAFATFLRIG